MIPFFALIGLVTVISIIVSLQINRDSLLRKIIGTVILSFACIFACLVILYPLYFGSYKNLIVSFVMAFVLLIGVYVVAGLLVNKRHLKNVVFVAAEGPAETSDSGNSKELIKPVQLRPASVPKTRRERKRLGAKTSRNEHSSLANSGKRRYEQSAFGDAASTDKESTVLSSLTQTEGRNAFLHDGGFDKEESEVIVNDLGNQPGTSTIEQAIEMDAAEQINSGVSVTEKVVGLQAEQADSVDWMDRIVSAIEADTEMVTKTSAINVDADQTDSIESAAEEDNEPQAKPEADDMDAEQFGSVEPAIDEDNEPQADSEADDMDAEQFGSVELAIDEDNEPQAESEADDMDAEIFDSVEAAVDEDNEPQAELEVDDMDADQTDSVKPATEEDKNSRMISKAIELKDQGNYLNAIFILQSYYDNINDAAVRKKADMQLMECFILSGQHHEAQKKWFDILNKKYDFEPDEKAKLKYMMAELNAGQL